MQTFFNPKTPFFDDEGKPLANARVTFLSVDTSGEPIVIHDYYGNKLDNPMTTQSDGTLKDVPYFEDGVSYKVVVEKSTGIPPVYVLGKVYNESELYQQPPALEFIVSAMGDSGAGIVNAQFVDGINGVRAAGKSNGSVVCVGYASKDDGCPTRVFTWNESVNPPADNGITIIRSSTDNSGFWKMEEPCGMFDVRVAGIFPSSGNTDSSPALANLQGAIKDYRVKTIYFPSGSYYFGGSHSINSLVIEQGCKIYPLGSNVTFSIEEFSNRGGTFCASSGSNGASRVIPCLHGLLRTAWLSGEITGFLTTKALFDVETIVFDDFKEVSTATAVTVSNKKVLIVNDRPSKVNFENCLVFSVADGTFTFDSASVGSSMTITHGTGTMAGQLQIKKGDKVIVSIDSNDMKVKNALTCNSIGFDGDNSEDLWGAVEGLWDGLFALFSRRAMIRELRTDSIASSDPNSKKLKIGTSMVTGKMTHDAPATFNYRANFEDEALFNGPVAFSERFGTNKAITLYDSAGYYIPDDYWTSGTMSLYLAYKSYPQSISYYLYIDSVKNIAGRKILIYTDHDVSIKANDNVSGGQKTIINMKAYTRMMFVCVKEIVLGEERLTWRADPFYI